MTHHTRISLFLLSAFFLGSIGFGTVAIFGPLLFPASIEGSSLGENIVVLSGPLSFVILGVGGFLTCWKLTKRLADPDVIGLQWSSPMEQRESIVARSFAIIRRRFSTLWIAAAWPHICVALCCLAFAITRQLSSSQEQISPLNLWQSMGLLGKFEIMTTFIIGTTLPQGIAIAGVVTLVWKYLETGVATLQDAFSNIARHLIPLVLLSVCIGAVVEIGLWVFVIPGLAALIFTAFAIPVLVIEHVGLPAALKRSFQLGAANAANLFGFILVSTLFGILLTIVPLIAFFIITTANLPSWVNSFALWTCIILGASLTHMVVATMLTHLYVGARGQRGEVADASAPSRQQP